MTALVTGRPRVPSAHLVSDGERRALFDVHSGKLFLAPDGLLDAIDEAMQLGDDGRVRLLMSGAGMCGMPHASPPPTSVPIRSVSLAVSATCNLGCGYCYAGQGAFGGAQAAMSFDVAKNTIERLLDDTPPGQTMRLVFLGGEPFANRATLQAATRYAAARGAQRRVNVAFSLTTNATLLTADDIAFLDDHAFAVTISIDGPRAAHDKLRPYRNGLGSYDRVIDRASLMLSRPRRRCLVAARVSVTPSNGDLRGALSGLVAHGFDSIQFSPVLAAPAARNEMTGESLSHLLVEMIECGRLFEEALGEGRIVPFANVIGALGRIHGRVRDDYPCGAGGSYVAASGNGTLYACHRFIDDENARLGDLQNGLDQSRQARWLQERNLRFQEPCGTCWARHLCGGGCHYEVVHRGLYSLRLHPGWLTIVSESMCASPGRSRRGSSRS